MKRFFSLFLAALLLFSMAASAEDSDFLKWRKRFINLSADELQSAARALVSVFSFDELIALREQLNLALWNSQEWQEVSVPIGIWEVGKDIPSGHWMIYPPEKDFGQVYYCQFVDFDTKLPDHSGKSHTVVIAGKKSSFANKTDNYIDYDMHEGWYFINQIPVTFMPYTGKPDLGFQ